MIRSRRVLATASAVAIGLGWMGVAQAPCTPSLFPIEGYQTPVHAGTVIQHTWQLFIYTINQDFWSRM